MSRAREEADLRFDELSLVTERLTKMIRNEIKVLKAGRPSELEAYGEEKAGLSASYARLSAALKRDREVLKSVSQERRTALKAVTTDFRNALEELEKRLSRARHLSEGMIRAIADDLSASQSQPVGYGVKAAPTAPGPARPQTIALNRVV